MSLEEPLLSGVTQSSLRHRSGMIIASLVVANFGVLGALLLTGVRYPHIVGSGILAYSFGLRHAVDADHIAAIDNVTRKLLRDAKPSLLVGFFFSLGHSSVVTLMTLLAMASSSYIQEHLEMTSSVGAVLGTLLSASLLFVIGLLNLLSALEIMRARQRSNPARSNDETRSLHADAPPAAIPPAEAAAPVARKAGGHRGDDAATEDADIEYMSFESPESGHVSGLVSRCCPAVFNAVDSEVAMYGVGFLFGLGFETSSEVALLALATMAPSSETPTFCALLLPALFAAGMSLIDTIDGVMMFWAYSWSASQPGGRDCYNLFLTSVSSAIAIGIGTVEVLGCLQHELHKEGVFWDAIQAINDNFEYVGYSIILFFALSGLAALGVWAVRSRRARVAR